MLFIGLMLGSRVRCRSWVCNHLIRQMNCRSQVNNHGTTHLNPLCLDSFKLSLRNNNSSNQIGCQWSSILSRKKSSLSFIPFKYSKTFYSSKPNNIVGKKPGDQESDTIKAQKPKKEIKTYITLLGVDNSMSITTIEEAKKLADRRNYTLEKVIDFDPKSRRAVYKLMTESQYLQYIKNDWEDTNSKKEKFNKDEKLVSLSSNTNDNDVLTKLKMIKKWLTKKLEVRVVINGDVKSGVSLMHNYMNDVMTTFNIVLQLCFILTTLS